MSVNAHSYWSVPPSNCYVTFGQSEVRPEADLRSWSKGIDSHQVLFCAFMLESPPVGQIVAFLRAMRDAQAHLPPVFGFARHLNWQDFQALGAAGVPCFTSDAGGLDRPEMLAQRILGLCCKLQLEGGPESAAASYLQTVRDAGTELVLPYFIGLEIDSAVGGMKFHKARADAARWAGEFARHLRQIAMHEKEDRPFPHRPVSAYQLVAFTSELENAADHEFLAPGMRLIDRRGADQHGIWTIRHFTSHVVHGKPSLADPRQLPIFGPPPLPRPAARPEEYAGYPPGVTPADLSELFRMIRQEADTAHAGASLEKPRLPESPSAGQ